MNYGKENEERISICPITIYGTKTNVYKGF